MKIQTITFALGVMVSMSSCDAFFEPHLTNEKTTDQLYGNPGMIAGLAFNGYNALPKNYQSWSGDFLDCATDNAVNNVPTSSMYKLASMEGFYTNISNPLDNWSAAYQRIRSINDFFEKDAAENIIYQPSSVENNNAYKTRTRGEAFFLRAFNYFDLLRRFAGVDTKGELVGYPILLKTVAPNEVIHLPRASFEDCVNGIVADLDVAMDSLPMTYTGDDYFTGAQHMGRASKLACLALKSRLYLYAASPLYNVNDDVKLYERAAEAAMKVLEVTGQSLPNLYDISNVTAKNDKLSATYFHWDSNDELILRLGQDKNTSVSKSNFPPGVKFKGAGRTNPTQNLVDAFPMANGYPIDHDASGYDPNNMYVQRDPRFYMTILYNNGKFRDTPVQIYQGGADQIGAAGVTDVNATKSGYYLRKWVSSKANFVGQQVTDFQYAATFRKVEFFLNFAEAANEAYGPDGGPFGFTARQAIAEVRRRAGIAKGGVDSYLASVTSKEDFAKLIQNERRVELCFEGHRYFDMRRLKMNLNEPIRVISFANAQDKVGTQSVLFTPVYKDYMYNCPIPNGEILKSPTLTQNKGWETL